MCKRVRICVVVIEGGLASVCIRMCINMKLLVSVEMFISCLPVNQRLAKIKNFSESC